MERYSREQRIEIIKIHYKNCENFTKTCHEVRSLFGRNEAPSKQIIMNLVKNFESVGHVGDVKTSIRSGKVKSAKTIPTVIERPVENQADPTIDSNFKTKENRGKDQSNTVDSTDVTPSIKIIGNGLNDGEITSPEDGSNVSNTSNDNSNQLKSNNSISTPKATRKMKRPRYR